MQLFTPLAANRDAPLARANPIAKLAAAFALMAVLLASIDPVTPALICVVLLVAVPLAGLSARTLIARAWPILALAVAIGLVNVLFGEGRGVPLVRIGPVSIASETAVTSMGLGLRLVGVALAGLVAIAATEPIDLADALIQQLGVSPRFAVGALAAVRLLPALAEERQTIALARRARGLEAGRSPLAAIRLAGGQLFGLLVAAVRKGTRLALAMEARGFGARPCRSVARPQRMRRSDWALIGIALAVGAAAILVSVAVGSWRPLWG
jgi:energy-coupling factor transport system permease protein